MVDLSVLVTAVAGVVCFVAYLVFCAFVVVRTGNTAGLRDVAVAMRAFRRTKRGRGS